MENKAGAIRMVRVPLPIDKIDEIDRIIEQGLGGFRDRQELIAEAIDAYLLELKYEQPPTGRDIVPVDRSLGARSEREGSALPRGTPVLSNLPDCIIASAGSEKVTRGPLFGLHNRDFPSIWAAWQLALMTADRLVPQSEYLKKITAEAWKVGEILRGIDAGSKGPKLAALFPTNAEKPGQSEAAFRPFGVGSCSLNDGLRCSGPLFLWNLCAAEQRGSELYLGLTDSGRKFLQSLDGISADIPHSADHADSFFRYLREHAPEDWWGFAAVLNIGKSIPTRDELLMHFGRERDHLREQWSDHQVGSYATGYISRCREWGILEPKLLNNRYYLTDYGNSLYLSSVADDA